MDLWWVQVAWIEINNRMDCWAQADGRLLLWRAGVQFSVSVHVVPSAADHGRIDCERKWGREGAGERPPTEDWMHSLSQSIRHRQAGLGRPRFVWERQRGERKLDADIIVETHATQRTLVTAANLPLHVRSDDSQRNFIDHHGIITR